MFEKSFGLLFFTRKPKNYQDGPLTIYLRITVDGAAKELSTKRKCEASLWSQKAGRAIGNRESVKELNRFLDVMEQSVYRTKRRLIDNDRELTVELLKDALLGADEKKIMILDVFRHHNAQLKALEVSITLLIPLIAIILPSLTCRHS